MGIILSWKMARTMFHAQNLDKLFWQKHEREGGLALYTCIRLVASPTQWCWMKICVSLMQITRNVCFLDYFEKTKGYRVMCLH